MMIFPDCYKFGVRICAAAFAISLAGSLAGCDGRASHAPHEPELVFPGAAPLAHRHRHHSLTESPDGQFRIYAAQKGDVTDLMVMRRLPEGGWSAPEVMDLPRLETNTSPRFSEDGVLYYSSDGPHPRRPGRKDLNIWQVRFDDGVLGRPEVLPDTINTGSNEDGFAPLGPDTAVFSSTTLGGVGGYDLYIASREGDDWSVSPFPHNTAMADSHPVTTPDGKTLIWYAHMPLDAVYGSVDLFISQYDGANWTVPKNLGPMINTQGIDYGPGVSADGKTLFFSRDGVLLEVPLGEAVASAGFVGSD